MIEFKHHRNDLKNIQKLMMIPAIRHLETESIGKLVSLSKVRQYEDSECIICEGDEDPWLHLLLSSGVRAEIGDVEIYTANKAGEIFGELRLLDGERRSANVYAVGKGSPKMDWVSRRLERRKRNEETNSKGSLEG